MVEKAIGYGSFSGSFCAEGEVLYDSETKCLVGEDRYSVDETGIRECEVKVRVPKTIWFDRIDVQTSEDRLSDNYVSVSVVVNNGPRVQDHENLERGLEDSLFAAFDSVMESTDDWDEVIFNRSLNFSEFIQDGDDHLLVIRDIEYRYSDCQYTDVNIPLTDLNDDDETNGSESN